MAINREDNYGSYEIRVDDPRGESWIYREPGRAVRLSFMHGTIQLEGERPVVEGEFASSDWALAFSRFLAFMLGGRGGFSTVSLEIRHPSVALGVAELGFIDKYVAPLGIRRSKMTSERRGFCWAREVVSPSRCH